MCGCDASALENGVATSAQPKALAGVANMIAEAQTAKWHAKYRRDPTDQQRAWLVNKVRTGPHCYEGHQAQRAGSADEPPDHVRKGDGCAHGGLRSATAARPRMLCSIPRMGASTHGECGVRFISRLRAWRHIFDNLYTTVRCYRSTIGQLRLWDICTHTLAEKGESISVAGACMSFGHASNGPDFDTDSSRNVNLLRLIALESSI
jgi:hypothetical protein